MDKWDECSSAAVVGIDLHELQKEAAFITGISDLPQGVEPVTDKKRKTCDYCGRRINKNNETCAGCGAPY